MSRFFRGFTIVWVVLRYGLDELVLSSFKHPTLNALRRVLTIGRKLDAPRGQRLREALEQLGPIFVKFGPGAVYAQRLAAAGCGRRAGAAAGPCAAV